MARDQLSEKELLRAEYRRLERRRGDVMRAAEFPKPFGKVRRTTDRPVTRLRYTGNIGSLGDLGSRRIVGSRKVEGGKAERDRRVEEYRARLYARRWAMVWRSWLWVYGIVTVIALIQVMRGMT